MEKEIMEMNKLSLVRDFKLRRYAYLRQCIFDFLNISEALSYCNIKFDIEKIKNLKKKCNGHFETLRNDGVYDFREDFEFFLDENVDDKKEFYTEFIYYTSAKFLIEELAKTNRISLQYFN